MCFLLLLLLVCLLCWYVTSPVMLVNNFENELSGKERKGEKYSNKDAVTCFWTNFIMSKNYVYISVKGREKRSETKLVREMNVDNSALCGNKGLPKCDRERQEEREAVCINWSGKEGKKTDLNHFDVLLIICCAIIFLTF